MYNQLLQYHLYPKFFKLFLKRGWIKAYNKYHYILTSPQI